MGGLFKAGFSRGGFIFLKIVLTLRAQDESKDISRSMQFIEHDSMD
ncbi:hypothetical protein X946_5005 [Burkholderia sp. ABCPW 111]|nr:hypothetical protein X946_5005 [Burkholderia sp. ABCPW 111]